MTAFGQCQKITTNNQELHISWIAEQQIDETR
uniref:Uncharacterized protein n=1 Tax=Rhizophora mucronata TaxID=61149 RepID=A0A2P2PZ42_RHIMU